MSAATITAPKTTTTRQRGSLPVRPPEGRPKAKPPRAHNIAPDPTQPPQSVNAQATETTESQTPERSLKQRMDALARANEIRIQRAQLKRDLKSGKRTIHSLLLEPPDYVETAKVFDMLLAVPKYGRVKVNKLLAHVRIAPSKTIGGMSERQRTELISLLHH